MLDAPLRKLIDPPLNRLARLVARTGISPNTLTGVGFAFGFGAALAVAFGVMGIALICLGVNRLLDGLDGAVARAGKGAGRPTEFGGYLDIVADFVLWAILPVGFAVADPANTLAACVLLASFIASGTTFLAHAILAAKLGVETQERGKKSFFHLGGLTEGAETIAFFVIVLIWPGIFVTAAYIFAALVTITAVTRGLETRRRFGS